MYIYLLSNASKLCYKVSSLADFSIRLRSQLCPDTCVWSLGNISFSALPWGLTFWVFSTFKFPEPVQGMLSPVLVVTPLIYQWTRSWPQCFRCALISEKTFLFPQGWFSACQEILFLSSWAEVAGVRPAALECHCPSAWGVPGLLNGKHVFHTKCLCLPQESQKSLSRQILPWLCSWGVESIACQPSNPFGTSVLFIQTSFHTWKFLHAFGMERKGVSCYSVKSHDLLP